MLFKNPFDLPAVICGTGIIMLVSYRAIRRLGKWRGTSFLVLLVGIVEAGSLWLDAHFMPDWNPIMMIVDVGALVLGFMLLPLLSPRSARQGMLIGLAVFCTANVTRYFPILAPYVNSPGSFALAGWLMALAGSRLRREASDDPSEVETKPLTKLPDELIPKP